MLQFIKGEVKPDSCNIISFKTIGNCRELNKFLRDFYTDCLLFNVFGENNNECKFFCREIHYILSQDKAIDVKYTVHNELNVFLRAEEKRVLVSSKKQAKPNTVVVAYMGETLSQQTIEDLINVATLKQYKFIVGTTKKI